MVNNHFEYHINPAQNQIYYRRHRREFGRHSQASRERRASIPPLYLTVHRARLCQHQEPAAAPSAPHPGTPTGVNTPSVARLGIQEKEKYGEKYSV